MENGKNVNTESEENLIPLWKLFGFDDEEQKGSRNGRKVKTMNKELKAILASGVIEDEEQARIFADNATFEYVENGWGDLRLETEEGFAEIYGREFKEGDEVVAYPSFDPLAEDGKSFFQTIRFFDKEMNPID